MLELLKIVFRDSGHDVIYSRVVLSTDYIQILHPDLILLDVRLNGVSDSGAYLCKQLKTAGETKNLPVVLVSAEYNLAEIASECQADMYLKKPYELTTLMSQVNKYLS